MELFYVNMVFMPSKTEIPVFTSASANYGNSTPSFTDVVDMEPPTTQRAHEIATSGTLGVAGAPQSQGTPNASKTSEVTTLKFDPRVLHMALELSGGDRGRLAYGEDGSILVKN